jgi:hypothetical protein
MTRHTRRGRKSSSRRQRQRGGGYSEDLRASAMINPGNQVHQAYPGPLKDCAGTPTRPGTMTDIGSLRVPGGLPGVSSMVGVTAPPVVAGPAGLVSNWFGPSWIGKGGSRKGSRKGRGRARRHRGGATQLGSGAPAAAAPATLNGTPMTNMNAVANTIKVQALPAAQKGGRYGFFPGDGPLNAQNGVGATGVPPFARIGCEVGTYNALNPDSPPQGIQTMSTLPFSPGHTPIGLTPMRGGFADRATPATVSVGAVDAMRYYAPTAGYDNLPMKPMVQNNPGILMQVGYPAGHFNQACLKSGGGRKSRRKTHRRRSARKQ